MECMRRRRSSALERHGWLLRTSVSECSTSRAQQTCPAGGVHVTIDDLDVDCSDQGHMFRYGSKVDFPHTQRPFVVCTSTGMISTLAQQTQVR